jgi:hypothetical protein
LVVRLELNKEPSSHLPVQSIGESLRDVLHVHTIYEINTPVLGMDLLGLAIFVDGHFGAAFMFATYR